LSRSVKAARARFAARSRAERVTLILLAVLFVVGALLRVGLTYAVRPALLGYSDSNVYLHAAARLDDGVWFASEHQPNGYPMFIELVHFVAAKLPLLILTQHLLGLASGLLLYATVRRTGGPPWLGLVPAGVIFLGGFQIFAEHAPLSEPLFVFLVAVALYAAVRAMDRPRSWWPAAVGLAIGMAPTVRTAGLTLVPLLLLWFLFEPGQHWRARALRAGAYAVPVVAVLGTYVIAQHSVTGYTGLSRTGIWNLYGRAAPFANCDKFTPPEGTEVLCEDTPEDERFGPSPYVYDVSRSPGLREFAGGRSAPTEAGNDEVGAFARAAILGQPLDYLRNVGNDMLRYIIGDFHTAGGGPSWEQFTTSLVVGTYPLPEGAGRPTDFRPYYPNPGLLQRDGVLEPYRDYERATRIVGVLFVIAFIFMLLAPFVAPAGRARRVALLLALVTIVLMITPIATLYYNARFTIPVFGPLAAGAALGGWGLLTRGRTAH
jgi:hypothetical protein